MRKRLKLIALLLAVLLLCGCTPRTVDELYCLPKRPEDYRNLQSAIDTVMKDLEYCAPLNGDHPQTVQMADLDGDGIDEYLLFAKNTTDKSLLILIFRETNGQYELCDTIQSAGAAFDVVEYARVDDRPGYELIVGHQVSEQVQRFVMVYSYVDGKAVSLLSANYSRFVTCDLNSDGRTGLLVLHPGESDDQNGVAEVYACVNGVMERSNQASMSEPVDRIKRIITGKLHGDQPAVYVASAVDDTAIITDVFALEDDRFLNISFSNESGTSVQTLRNYYVYADDIDEDGVVELPDLINMRVPEGATATAMQYLIRWYAMTVDGKEIEKKYTFHNFVSGWYLTLNSQWAYRLAVIQQGNDFEFYLWDEQFSSARKMMSLYMLSGEQYEQQSQTDEYVVLYKTDNLTYAAKLEPSAAEYGIASDSLAKSFYLIHRDWKNGET